METKAPFFFLFYSFLCIHCLTKLTFARPTTDDDQPLRQFSGFNFPPSEATRLELLKNGDIDAWRRNGDEVEKAISETMERGLAHDPLDALLMLFYPNLTPSERDEVLRSLEPVWTNPPSDEELGNDGLEAESSNQQKKKGQFEANAPAESKESENNEQAADHLRNALRELKIRPSESLSNLLSFDDRKRPPQRRADGEGQKEMPVYLGTHESPKGISWRV